MFEALSILAGSASIVTVLLFFRQTKRLKAAEAFNAEVAALKETVQLLQSEVEFDKKRIAELQSEVLDLTQRWHSSTESLYVLVRSARKCPYAEHPADCPVLQEYGAAKRKSGNKGKNKTAEADSESSNEA